MHPQQLPERTRYTYEVQNDVTGTHHEVRSSLSRPQIIERMVFLYGRPLPDSALTGCVHLYRDRIVVHLYAVPGREDEALEAIESVTGRAPHETP